MQESFGAYIPFVDHLGFEMVFFDDGQSELRFEPEPEHMNSFNVTHGGALMTLLDVTLATAARSVERTSGVVTVEMKTTFMQPARGVLTSKGRLIHRSRSMAFTEGTVYDAQGQVCAHATGTFKYVPKAPDPSHPVSDISTD
ncbi:phenylacetic acid degradation protein [Limnohabitans sp. JirII-29]|uniref:PaaI family thioesterase n=1 Tax=unclassified Limnohabitans TaxID=2626134 RepID=UPI000C1EDED7|nr:MULTISPECIES: PaaI family thioesterase [unclassified Limnohabitans]PIT80946.1 phenylacetic acid degradation protein [Limnohabitans sp. JirII-31]PUE28292.1 phenylacetic acid degradation protein [Limnohabitans sp. JirII-29]